MRTPARYSDNPKMDKSGISAEQPKYGYRMNDKTYEYEQVGTTTVPGGELYAAALDEAGSGLPSVTDPESLRKIAALVSQGRSKDEAVDIVAREVNFTPEGHK